MTENLVNLAERDVLKYSSILIKAKLIRRYKRFLADVILSTGEEITVHCPNTGAMTSCMDPGSTVYLSDSNNEKRKYRYTWELTKTKNGYIGINTQRPNRIFEHWLTSQTVLPELFCYDTYKREAKYGESSKIDFLLSNSNNSKHYIEIKNCTFYDKSKDILYFPDAKSLRATKHVKELIHISKKKNHIASVVLLVNRPEGNCVSPAEMIDHSFAEALREAQQSGVNIYALRVKNSLRGSMITDPVPVVL